MVAVSHEPPQPPPMVQECRYQVRIGGDYTYKCLTEDEYQQKQKRAQELQKESDEWMARNWWKLVLGFCGLVMLGAIVGG